MALIGLPYGAVFTLLAIFLSTAREGHGQLAPGLGGLMPLPGHPIPGNRPYLPKCPITDPFAYMRDPFDCGMFYRCFWGRAVPMSGCTPGLVFSTILNICVYRGSSWDNCVPQTIPPTGVTPPLVDLTPAQRCAGGEKAFPHPNGCALFYNCSLIYTRVPPFFEQHLDECPYPKLFNEKSLQCEDFQNVTCASRTEPKAGCDYRRNQCPRSHCIPCWVFYPSCVNVTDGLHFDRNRMWTPIFVECFQQRSMAVKQCQPVNGIPQIFSPDILRCVSIYDVSRVNNGLQPTCTAKQNALHPEENGRCSIYYQCNNGEYAGYGKCPDGLNFDPLTQSCQLSSAICPPCGNNQTACTQ